MSKKRDAFDPKVILGPGIATAVATHPIEHSLYGRKGNITKVPFIKVPTFGGKSSGKFFKGFKPLVLDKRKSIHHFALRAPKSLLASSVAFGAYNALSNR
jgi:hypothetical protein